VVAELTLQEVSLLELVKQLRVMPVVTETLLAELSAAAVVVQGQQVAQALRM
jgi:hypothetical protein